MLRSLLVEKLKELVIHFEYFSDEVLEELRELVEDVVDWSSEPELWEVEI